MSHAISVGRLFSSLGYDPHSEQVKVHKGIGDSASRFRVVCAGRRTGKSTMGGHELVIPAVEAYHRQDELSPHGLRMEYWIVGPEYTDGEKEFRVLWNDLTRLEFPLDRPGSYNSPLDGNMHVSLWGGRFQVHVKSAKYPDNLVGEALHGVVLAEAAKLKPKIWTKYIRPMLADYRGWALMTSTPEGKNWFYEAWQRGQRGDLGWWSARMPSWTNTILFPDGMDDPEIQAMQAELTPEMFAQEVGADFTEYTGRVFKEFDEEMHVRHVKFDPSLPVYAAVDYGWSNPFVWLLLQVDVWDNVYIIGEYYERHKSIDDIPEELRSRGLVPSTLRSIYPDPASPGDTAVLEKHLKVRGIGGTGGEVKERIGLIRRWLRVPVHLQHLPEDHPERIPKLFIDHSCTNTIREFQDYRYPENKSEVRNDSELPMKKDDHTPEALGRFFAGHFGHKQDESRTRVRRSSLAGSR